MTVLLTEKNKITSVQGMQSVDTGLATGMVKLALGQQVTFIVMTGTLAQTVTFKAYQSTTSSGGSAVAANYQKASTGTSTKSELDGAYTTLTSASGVAMTTSTDNYKILTITVRASDLTATYTYVGLVSTASSGNNYCGVLAIVSDERYGQAIPPSTY